LELPEYLYNALPSTRHIRLLKIESYDSGPSRLTLTLEPQAVGDSSTFTAFSYTWGDPTEEHTFIGASGREVVCDGATIRVPINLFSALVRMAEDDDYGPYFWAAALCIYVY
jgi:hypothetical protein